MFGVKNLYVVVVVSLNFGYASPPKMMIVHKILYMCLVVLPDQITSSIYISRSISNRDRTTSQRQTYRKLPWGHYPLRLYYFCRALRLLWFLTRGCSCSSRISESTGSVSKTYSHRLWLELMRFSLDHH